MGYTTSTVHGIDVPDSAEANNVPEDLQKIVDVLETGSLIKRLSGSTISGLTNAQKPAGLVVYNTTTNKLQISNGSTFANIDASLLALAGGTMTGTLTMSNSATIAMGSAKITGLAAATNNGDAVRYEQISTLGNWQAWTPTWVSGTTVTVTSARYTQIGKTVHWSMNASAASGGDLDFTLPVTAASSVRSVGHYSAPLNTQFSTQSVEDFGPILMVVSDATRGIFQRISQDATGSAGVLAGSGVGLIGFHASGTYEAA